VFTKDGESYVVTVRTWDAVDREATSGDPTYAADQETTTLDSDPAVTGNTWLDATQKSLAPWVDLTWSRPVMPDGWAVYRDGEVIYVADTAADVLVSGNVYNVVDWTAAPNREHVYRVAPIVNGKTAKGGVTETMTPVPTGVWVGDPSTGDDVMVLGSTRCPWRTARTPTRTPPSGRPRLSVW
jgi:hypothetical protein